MSSDSTFVCGRCQRTLPKWLEAEESSLCKSCDDNEESVVWATDQEEGSVTTEMESNGASPDSTADTTTEVDKGSSEASPPDPSNGTLEEEHTDATAESAEAESTGTGNHILDIEWEANTDLSQFEEAKEQSKPLAQETQETAEDPLDRKIDSWKEQLLDLTRRSNLVDFKPTKTKTLPFHRGNPITVAQQLFERESLFIRRSASNEEGGGPPDTDSLASDELASIRSREDTENSLYRIELNQKRFQRERGVDSLFLTLGTLRWYDVDHSDSELRAPLFLVQVDLEEETNRNPDRHDYEITTGEAELRVNPALRKMLSAERGIILPPDTAFDLEDVESAFAYIEEVISGFDRWHIAPEVILGIFDFSKFGLYTDLEENRQAVKEDSFVQALNGDPSSLPSPPATPSASELDEQVSPADTYQVLDADSSQQEAIEAAKRGMSFVLQGPPGTGKSQTISNIIAEKMAAGETVLFVSEKQAALNVVKNRLDDVGLGRFCLEAHGEKANKKSILEDLGNELQSDPLQHPSDRNEIVADLEQVRTTLNEYQDRLFYSPENQNITAYDAFGIVSKRDNYPNVDVGIDRPAATDQATIDDWVSELEALTSYEYEFSHDSDHPWRFTTLDAWKFNTTETVTAGLEEAEVAIESLQDAKIAAEEHLDEPIKNISQLREAEQIFSQLHSLDDVSLERQHFDSAFFSRTERLEQLASLVNESAELRANLSEEYDETLFSEDGSELHDELNDYGILRYVSPSYRRLKSRILSHATEEYAPDISGLKEDAKDLMRIQTIEDSLGEYDQLIGQLGTLYKGERTDWEEVTTVQKIIAKLAESDLIELGTVRSGLLDGPTSEIETSRTQVQSAIEEWETARVEIAEFIDLEADPVTSEKFSTETHAPEQASLTELEEWIWSLQDSVDELQEWIQYQSKREEIANSALGHFLEEYLDDGHPPEDLVDTFKRSFYTKWLNQVYSDTDLSSFSATEFDKLIAKFRQLDEQQREYAKAEIQHRVTNRRPKTELQHASSAEQVTLRREVQKSRRHMPLRELFSEAPSLITDLKPCFMMSPLSVAQYIQLDTIEFDTVIFDEASQIMPQDAVSSLIRGEQVIIAGDSKQLPPTAFFNTDIETAEDVREDLESILDEASTVLPEKRLLWHYRSETNELIEFSNTKYYNGALQTFPDNSPEEDMGVEFVFVEDGLYDRGGSSTNEPEARRVLELIKEHIENHSDRSLGVVAFSSGQAQAIRDIVEEERANDPDLDAFVSEDDALEEFFVKSLENVQGDERDSLIFSVGYGPDSAGKLSMNFGPLNKTGGERRLNVAVTRSKKHIQVVSSMQPGDIDLQRTGARGVRDFKHYLEYAKNGGRALTRADSEPQTLHFDSEFEEAVYTALESRGFDVVTQVESSGYSIDLAIKHPEKPGKYVLGIECDGAAYHHSKTARDRDRTRQAVLEDLGWTIHRIWSPDWASNKQSEVEEIESKVSRLVKGQTATDGGATTSEIKPVEVDAIPEGERGGIEDHLSDWAEPRVSRGRDRSLDDVDMALIASVLGNLVDEFGPVQQEEAFRETISKWQITRLGKRIKKRLNRTKRRMKRENLLTPHNGFLWPGERPSSIPIRQNTDTASRSVDEIPLEELAYAGHLILEAGNEMSREDLILEITRLYGYQRIGSNIKDRVGDAVSVLVSEGCAELSDDGESVIYVDVDAVSRLLDRIYG